MRGWALGPFLLGLACLVPRVQILEPDQAVQAPDWLYESYELPPQVSNARYLGRFKTTFYWVVEEKDYPKAQSVPLYDQKGRLVGRFSSAFVRDFKREAAARLEDGRCLSYLKKANRVVVDSQFLGINGHRLTELRSVAVDPRVVPIGSMVYIPQAENVVVNGQPLSGVFRAHDIGSAVKGKHIDIFVGSRTNVDAFQSAGMKSLSSVDVYILE